MTKVLVEFDLVINMNDDWMNASEGDRRTSTSIALKDLSNELQKIEVSQGVFTLVATSTKTIE